MDIGEPEDKGGDVKMATAKEEQETATPKKPQRRPPRGLQRQKVAANGDCLFSALSAGVAKALNIQEVPPKQQVKAQILQHVNKRKDNHMHWDGNRPDDKKAKDWEEYMQEITKPGARGGALEIHAAATTWNLAIFIGCAEGTDMLVKFENDGTKPCRGEVYLW